MPRTRKILLLLGILLIVGGFALSASYLGDSSKPKESGPPDRIVSLAPSTTEILFAIGAGDQVVGVSSYTTHPPAATSLPHLGGQLDPDVEALAGLDPDCVVTMGSLPRVADHVQQLGIELVEVPMDTLEEVLLAINTLGELTNREEAASSLRSELEEELAALPEREGPPVSVLLVIGREPGHLRGIYVAGRNSFLSGLLEAAGGRNAAAPLDGLWPAVPLEWLVSADPDVIIEIGGSSGEPRLETLETSEDLSTWSRELPQLSAVQSGQIYQLTGEGLLIPGPRMPRTALWLARALAPES